jgi:23S rRNA (uracil1939-C5)-methyltransferase
MKVPGAHGRRLRGGDLDDDGAGLGTLSTEDGALLVHAPGLLPGDEARVEFEHVSPHRRAEGRPAWARVLAVETPSPDRVAPACVRQATCGGCPLMILEGQAQLAFKRRRVQRAFAAYPALATVPVDACGPSPREEGYRNHAKYVFGPVAGRPVLGAYAPRSHTIVDQAGCRVVEPVLEAARAAILPCLAHLPAFDEVRRVGLLRHVVLRANRAGRVLVALVIGQADWPDAEAVAAALAQACPAIAGVVLNVNRSGGNAILGTEERLLFGQSTLEDAIGPATLRLSARSFFQANREVAAALYAEVRAAIAALGPVDRVVDVYSGAGGIAQTLVDVCREVVAIEENPATTAAAEAHLRERGIAIPFFTGDAADGLARIDRADAVVLNPPRKGCAPAVLDRVRALRPRRVVYVSCDPGTLARDLARLVEGGGQVVAARPFDMMPHTPHVETLAIVDGVGHGSGRP